MVAPAPGEVRPSKAHKARRSKSQSAGGASIHKNVAYVRSAAPRDPKRRRTGAYIGNKTAIVKARFHSLSAVPPSSKPQCTVGEAELYQIFRVCSSSLLLGRAATLCPRV